MSPVKIAIIAAAVLVLGIIVFPVINRRSFRNLPFDQQVRILMKESKGTAYFKNVSKGSAGTLYFVKNRRKIIAFPWIISDGNMLCTRSDAFVHWDYPEEQTALTDDEKTQLLQEIENFNKKNIVKIIFK